MTIKKSLLPIALLTTTLCATDTLTHINLEQDSDGNFHPNIFIPINWDKNSYSGLGYSSTTSKDISVLDGFANSKNGIITTTNDIFFRWVGYRFDNISAAFQSNFTKIQKNEFGYIHDSENLFGNGTNYYVAFDNDIQIDMVKTGFYVDYTKKISDILFRVSSTLTPSTSLKVKQNTLFKPLVLNNGTSSSTTSQDFAYSLKLETYYDTNMFFKLGFEYSYDYMPIKYDIAQLATSNGNYIFEQNNIDTDQITTKYLGKIYFDKKLISELIPSIGFGNKKIKTKDNKSSSSSTKDENIFTIGFEKRF
jgi:hypothetical protein